MGMNYYYYGKPRWWGVPKHIHIGKSSAGWCFALHVTDEITSLEDWKKKFKKMGSFILDETGKKIKPKEMLSIITERKSVKPSGKPPGNFRSWDEFNKSNHVVPGPNGLSRHKIDDFCIGHGEGTWDLMTGYFS